MLDQGNEAEQAKNQGERKRFGSWSNPAMWRKPTLTQIFVMIFLLGMAVYWVGTIVQMFSSFEDRVSGRIRLQDITSIEVTRTAKGAADGVKVTVTDQAKIAEIMDAFADVKLRSSDASHNYTNSYSIQIDVNKYLRFSIDLDDHKYIYIFDHDRKDKYSSGFFKIINHYDMQSIESLFP